MKMINVYLFYFLTLFLDDFGSHRVIRRVNFEKDKLKKDKKAKIVGSRKNNLGRDDCLGEGIWKSFLQKLGCVKRPEI